MICYLLEISLILCVDGGRGGSSLAPLLPFIYLFCFILPCSRLALCLTDCLNCFAPPSLSPLYVCLYCYLCLFVFVFVYVSFLQCFLYICF